ncbi:uncharacterized protein LOC129296398 [Prosopis cineraria]|uniref:uncharacterized protein LOC129296398 n=1 Tax=Prosopis cineraria TaxID=364024 RepID=UPI00240EE910|nr:uncharacterized protein LOC129296398 [Prosopis cineraria]
MNIHRKDKVAKSSSTKPTFPAASTSTKLYDHETDHAISSFPPGNYFSTELDQNSNYNYPPSQFPFAAAQYSGQKDRDVFGGDNWRTGLSLSNMRDDKEKIEGSSEDDALDLELRLGYHS